MAFVFHLDSTADVPHDNSRYADGMPNFNLSHDRDAWGAIRGYVYQVHRTIDRWLSLQTNEILALEHGEDIDIVTRSLNANDLAERARLLEQIGSSDKSLTLHKPKALGTIALAALNASNR